MLSDSCLPFHLLIFLATFQASADLPCAGNHLGDSGNTLKVHWVVELIDLFPTQKCMTENLDTYKRYICKKIQEYQVM